ncbi:MAG: LysM peptidoglycan-binding domain-containing protein [Planctomycetota bacterium]
MRNPTLLALASVAFLVAAGCQDRANLRELPDRQGHAYRTEGAERPLANQTAPYQDEQTYTVTGSDTLILVSKKFNTTVDAIVRRNDLQTNILTPGQVLIVKKLGAPTK